MQDWIGYIILFLGFCVFPTLVIGLVAFAFWKAAQTRKATQGNAAVVKKSPATKTPPPDKGTVVTPSRTSAPVKATASASAPIMAATGGEHTPIYLNFSNKPQAIIDNIDALVAQANQSNTSRTRWSKGPRRLFWAGLALIAIEGIFYLLGYSPSCAFLTGGIALWIVGIFLSTGLRRAQVKSFPPRFVEFKEMIQTLRDDLRPGSGFLGNLDLTGAKQASKVARAANDTRGRTTNYYRDVWLIFKS